MNTYKTHMNNGEMVIDFIGQIGTYWREGKISFSTNGMSLVDIQARIQTEVESNKVCKETSLLDRFAIRPSYQTYLISNKVLEEAVKAVVKDRTGVDAMLTVDYDVDCYIARLYFDERWWDSLSKEEKLAFSDAMWKGFDIYDDLENMKSIIQLIFGTSEVNGLEAFNMEGDTFDVEVQIPNGVYVGGETLYISAFTESNLINDVKVHTDLECAVRSMNEALYDNFDRECDDARIFTATGEEVYSFPDEAASLCKEYDMTQEQYVEFAVKLWKGDIRESGDNSLEDLVMSYVEQFEN